MKGHFNYTNINRGNMLSSLFTDYRGRFTGMCAFSTSLHAPDERMDA